MFSLPLLKAEVNAGLHCIQIQRVTEVTMQVKRAIGKAILHKLPNILNTRALMLSLHIILHELLFVFQL